MARDWQRKGEGMTPEEVNSRKKSHFLRVLLENGGFKDQAIKQCRTSRRWYNEQLEADEEFAGAVNAIIDITNEELVVEARRRARGYKEDVWFQGRVVGQKLTYSDNLLMFLIKGRMPEYRDGPGAKKGLEISDDEMNEAIRRFAARKAGKPVADTNEVVN